MWTSHGTFVFLSCTLSWTLLSHGTHGKHHDKSWYTCERVMARVSFSFSLALRPTSSTAALCSVPSLSCSFSPKLAHTCVRVRFSPLNLMHVRACVLFLVLVLALSMSVTRDHFLSLPPSDSLRLSSWFVSHMWLRGVTPMNESCHAHEYVIDSHLNKSVSRKKKRVMSRICMSAVGYWYTHMHMHESSGLPYLGLPRAHIWMRHVTEMKTSYSHIVMRHAVDCRWRPCRWVVTRVWMKHVAHMNESCSGLPLAHIWISGPQLTIYTFVHACMCVFACECGVCVYVWVCVRACLLFMQWAATGARR